MLAQTDNPYTVDPWAFVPHPEVWLLVSFLVGAYVYMVRVIGPTAVGPGERPVTARNVRAFTAAIVILWVSSDWPVHDISEDYLYWVHMFQHMALSFFVPPLALIATPAWLMRTIIGTGVGYRTLKWFCHPVVAGVLFNGVAMLTHIPLLVNASVGDGFWNGALHYGLHVAVVVASLLMWMPIVGPIQEFRIGVPGKMIYLFLQSVVPTVPAAWLTFAEGSVYDAYETPIRLWGISVASDQQLAGAVMKLIGGMYLWAIVIYIFATQFAKGYGTRQDLRRPPEPPLTTEDVEKAFAASTPVVEDH